MKHKLVIGTVVFAAVLGIVVLVSQLMILTDPNLDPGDGSDAGGSTTTYTGGGDDGVTDPYADYTVAGNWLVRLDAPTSSFMESVSQWDLVDVDLIVTQSTIPVDTVYSVEVGLQWIDPDGETHLLTQDGEPYLVNLSPSLTVDRHYLGLLDMMPLAYDVFNSSYNFRIIVAINRQNADWDNSAALLDFHLDVSEQLHPTSPGDAYDQANAGFVEYSFLAWFPLPVMGLLLLTLRRKHWRTKYD